ncbi:MAG: hypothetical protein U5K79_05865 [Cyclobacteriaceae bacterium]|nr:hypothetical protein [Cyclobacteriaceae bacterium]
MYTYATDLGQKLLDNPRIREYDIQGENGWSVNTLHEYNMDFNQDALAQKGIKAWLSFTENY